MGREGTRPGSPARARRVVARCASAQPRAASHRAPPLLAQACPPVVALPSVGPARQPSAELRRVLRALLTRSVAHRMSLNALRLDPWLTKQHTAPLAAQPSLRAPAPPQAAAAPAAASPVEQVSGHAGALARAGQTVLAKASTAAEFSFYAAIASSDLALHVPILYGRRRSNGAPTGSPPAAGSGACVLLVQDITEGMGAPCLMDVKMGSRTVLDAELADGTLRADLLKKMVRRSHHGRRLPSADAHAAAGAACRGAIARCRPRRSSALPRAHSRAPASPGSPPCALPLPTAPPARPRACVGRT